MAEHLSNGQFARKEVTEGAPTKEVRKSGFQKGHRKLGGRKPGTPNKATRAVKEFLAELCNKVSVQEAVEARIEKGDAVAFFRALEHVVGKPKESREDKIDLTVEVKWLS